ncbi:uncharacterized protein MYCFIDRAFT_189135 [Pseudocercospora fijiensis CIRAD86]|uniref:Uncharacterized protein n=1 Tax=Pseudocercospora fijiensis (strain CIRAD86) TaxID=383855 RepID=M3A7X3_PSEFD|nr:uncharacterized protein MYCFIDRAFT_189135 [Pseudocercospora fijiensis CIRAD86]EME80706.1 hypothetical protein MYCFIDRAFT_189135 [Pseudocercospora fijiensis CIRAD86]
MSSPTTSGDDTRSLLDRALALNHARYGFSTASCQIYDTAWVSMIKRSTKGIVEWTFPESFHWLIRAQNSDGSWGSSKSSRTAKAIDTAASLLALLKHAESPLQLHEYGSSELKSRVQSALESLTTQLRHCNDIESTNHIGVELVLPALIRYLREELPSSNFFLRVPAALEAMSEAKASQFQPELLYKQKWSPAIYHLEAFVGKIDFDRVTQQAFENGSMWTSPAATAAYLIHATTWDDQAEAYLRHVIREGQGHGNGSVPGTFPTKLFEFNWIVATLISAGYDLSELDSFTLDRIGSIVKAEFLAGHGVIGHGQGATDADDTAKGLLALRLLGREDGISPDHLIRTFEKEDGFSTFGGERDRSVSTNCHVLLALLSWNNPSQYALQIRKAASFVCEYWWSFLGQCKDKWHLSRFYAWMLIVESLASLLQVVEANLLSDLLDDDLKMKIAVILTQICTAYAVLILGKVCRMCFLSDLASIIRSTMDLGVAYLENRETNAYDERYWTSKTQYGVKFVTEAYVLAAHRVALSGHAQATLLKRTKHFRNMPEWLMQASLIESTLWLPGLRTRRLEIFPRDDRRIAKDAYFTILPALWICCQNRSKKFVPNSFVNDMLFMTLINIQVDEFIEAVITPTFEDHPGDLHDMIDHMIDDVSENRKSLEMDGIVLRDEDRVEKFLPLRRFAEHILQHERIRTASRRDRAILQQELRSFLHTQATQMEDNSKLRKQPDEQNLTFHTEIPFFTWVRTTAADHVSTPFTVAWVRCWISSVVGKGTEAFQLPTEKYFASALARHIATTNRMYNDLGSIRRDVTERNLNSVHFPEFAGFDAVEERKKALQSLAEYEQKCVEGSREKLEEAFREACSGAFENSRDEAKLHILGALCDVASLWDQLYTIRDLSSQIKLDRSKP